MKKIGITDSEKKLLLIVLALLILAVAYFFGYTKLTDQAKSIETSNERDASTVAQLEGMVERSAETQKETEDFKQTIKDIIAKYPIAIPQEKSIYLIQQMQDTIGIYIPSISFSMSNLVMNFSGENAPSGRYANLGMPFTSTYDQFKDILRYVAEQPDRTIIPNINASFDQTTGLITGSFNYKMYYLTNTDKEYEPFPETGIESGVTSIFYNGDMEWEAVIEFLNSMGMGEEEDTVVEE